MTEPLLVYPSPVAADLAQALDRAGYAYLGVADEVDAERKEPEDGWGGAVIMADRSPDDAYKVAVALSLRAEVS